jgi:hypothetical protein
MAQLGFGLNINKTAAETGYDQYQIKLGETLSAVAEDNWNFNPLSSIQTYYDLESARSSAQEESAVRISRDELNKEYSDIGLFFKEDEYQSVVDIMVEKKKEERARQSIIQRGPKGFVPGVAKFATGLGVSLFDPINIASAFIPVVGQARFAGLVAKTGFARARLVKGAAEGAVGAAVVEPIVYGVSQKVQADYGLVDSFLNITFGTILGGGLHVGAGALKDLRTSEKFQKRISEARKDSLYVEGAEPELNLYREYYPENSKVMRDLEKTNPQTRKLLLEKSLNDMMSERPVDTSAVVNADPVLRKSADSSSTTQVKNRSESNIDQVELNTVEQSTINKTSKDVDIDNNLLLSQRNELRNNQKYGDDIDKIFDKDEADAKKSTEELDEMNTRSDDISKIIRDGINCVNGR